MKTKKITSFSASIAAALGGLVSSASAVTVVYEDTFDNDGLATNTSTGGGLVQHMISATTFNDNGNLTNTTGRDNSERGVISSVNSFDLANGFTLEVHMTGGTTAILQSFGLSKTQFTVDASASTMNQDWLREAGWAGESVSGDAYGIGVETGGQAGLRGLKFNNGAANASAITNLSTSVANLLPSGTNTFILTVTPDDQFSYSYNGGTAVTGDIVSGGSFDLSAPLFFNIFSQSDLNVSSVKITDLTAVPEPSSIVMLGLGGLALLLRRRK